MRVAGIPVVIMPRLARMSSKACLRPDPRNAKTCRDVGQRVRRIIREDEIPQSTRRLVVVELPRGFDWPARVTTPMAHSARRRNEQPLLADPVAATRFRPGGVFRCAVDEWVAYCFSRRSAHKSAMLPPCRERSAHQTGHALQESYLPARSWSAPFLRDQRPAQA